MHHSRDVLCVLAPNPSLLTGAGTNSYVVVGRTGGCVIIDPGTEAESHLARLAELAAHYGGAQAILITHGHPDHLGGAIQLRARIGAPIVSYSATETPGTDRVLADREEMQVGGRALIPLHTPGHRFDHLSFLLPDTQTLIAGDLVAGAGTVVIAPPEGDMADYLRSLHHLLSVPLQHILPGHGPVIDQPRHLLEQYIRHRQEREMQVLAAVTSGLKTAPQVVAHIYADVAPDLHPVAALTVEAHLIKLQREGRLPVSFALPPLSAPDHDSSIR